MDKGVIKSISDLKGNYLGLYAAGFPKSASLTKFAFHFGQEYARTLSIPLSEFGTTDKPYGALDVMHRMNEEIG